MSEVSPRVRCGAGTDSGLLAPVWPGAEPAGGLSDEAWVAAMLEVEEALARAQAGLGVIPESSAETIGKTARSLRVDVAGLAQEARGAANPVVALVGLLTAAVAQTDPAAAEHVHLGSTSQDVLDSAAMLLTVRALTAVERDLTRTADALAVIAREHRNTPMAARTLAQHAVPTTFGLKAAGWLDSVLDALARLRDTAAGLPAQLGGAAGTLAAYEEYARGTAAEGAGHGVELARGVAAELGLREQGVPWHSLRMPLCDTGWTLSAVTGALGKFALDVQVLSRTEIGELAEPAAAGRGASSAMPQKRNPVLATLIVSAARQLPAYTSVLAQSMLAEDERAPGAWHAEWQPLREALRLACGAAHTAAELAEGLEVFPRKMRGNLELTGGAVVSERLNAALAGPLGKTRAKRLLADHAHRAAAGEGDFAELLAAEPELTGALPDGVRVADLLDPGAYLGAASALTTRVLERHARDGAVGGGAGWARDAAGGEEGDSRGVSVEGADRTRDAAGSGEARTAGSGEPHARGPAGRGAASHHRADRFVTMSGAMTTPDTDLTVRAIRLLGGFQYAQAGFAVARLGVAGHLMDGPLPVPELARRTGTDPGRLRQLLRVLAGEELFTLLDEDRVELGPLGPSFVPGTATSAYELALSWADTLYAPFAALHHTLCDGVPAPEHHYGRPMFEWLAARPEQAGRFSAMMREGIDTLRAGIPASLDLTGIGTVVDVGGADGTLLSRVAALHPGLRGVVFDLPHVVEAAEPLLRERELSARIGTAGGDFFEAAELPAGADCYLLSYILHDWPDRDAARILRAVRTAGGPNCRLRLVELVLPDWQERPLSSFAATMDLTMLGMLGARERTAGDWERMLTEAGFRLDRIAPTSGPHSVLEATAADVPAGDLTTGTSNTSMTAETSKTSETSEAKAKETVRP